MSDLRLKCTRINFEWGCALDSAYSASLDSLHPFFSLIENCISLTGKNRWREGRGKEGNWVEEILVCILKFFLEYPMGCLALD